MEALARANDIRVAQQVGAIASLPAVVVTTLIEYDIIHATLGLALVDMALLEPLAAACREEGRWEFLLIVSPLNVPGGTVSPVNPLAIF